MSTVALNFQTPGYEMDLNAGRFLVNGQCGYVLKPACLRQPNTTFDPEYPGPPRTTLTIQVRGLGHALPGVPSAGVAPAQRPGEGAGGWCECLGPGCSPHPLLPAQVLTAQQLPKLNAEKPNSIVDPLVRIEIHGVPADCARKETNYVLNNGAWGPCWGRGGKGRTAESGGRCWAGLALRALDCQACTLGFNPRWGQTLQFQLRVPELALVRFVVEDYDVTSPNDFVGQFTLPLSSLKQGWWGLVGWKGMGCPGL